MKQVPYVKTIMGDTETPITIFQKYVGDQVGFLLESKSREKNRFSFIGANPKEIITPKDKQKITRVLEAYLREYEICNTTHLPFMGGIVGVMSYDVSLKDNGINSCAKDVLDLPLGKFFLVTEFIAYDHDYGKILLVAIDTKDSKGEKRANEVIKRMEGSLKSSFVSQSPPYASSQYTSNMTKDEFVDKVKKSQEYILKGDISQVVISQRWKAKSNIHPFQLYRNLRTLNPSPYLFYFNFGDYQIVGSSPEMLVEIKNGKISTCPIAGTRPRGINDLEDKVLAAELLQDPKEIKEHIMLVDLAKEDMSLVAAKESIKVKDYMKVHKYSHVMHITSMVEGMKREDLSSLEVLNSFMPAGTLSGYPRQKAMEIIDELEEEKRGFYGGAAGYIGFTQDMDVCIAIRMMIVKDQHIYMQAGAGIVLDSDPVKEYEESENKVKALVSALYMGSE